MSIADYALRIPGIRERIERIRRNAFAEGRAAVAEAAVYEDDYAFRRLSEKSGIYELPESFVQVVLAQSHKQYHANGIATFIVERAASILLEGGLTYTLAFDELAPDADESARAAYGDYKRAVEKRLETWWNSDETDIDERSTQFVTELLLSGEHGWRFKVDPSNGTVRVGDVSRVDVGDLAVDEFDRTRLRKVQLANPADQEQGRLAAATRDARGPWLEILRASAGGLLSGDVAYHRWNPTPTMKRGRPILQPIVDELASEKQFRVLWGDRAIARAATFLETKIDGAKETDLEAAAKKYGTAMPRNGSRVYTNEHMTNTFVSAAMEAGDGSTWIQTMMTVIAGSLGWPLSWFGYGNDTNRATADSQQEPAYRNLNRQKRQLMRVFESVLWFVHDSAARVGYFYAEGEPSVKVKGREEGSVISKRLRDCLTITVSTKPLAKKQKDAAPLSALKAASEFMIGLRQIREEYGIDVFTPEQLAQIVSAACSTDGVDIEVYGDQMRPRDAQPVGAL